MKASKIIPIGLAATARGLIMGATALPAQAASDTRVENVQLSDRNDSGEDGNNWATDEMHRQIKITETSAGVYDVVVSDNGRFTTGNNELTPGGSDGGATFSSPVDGTVKGGFHTTVHAAAHFATFAGLPHGYSGSEVSTSAMIEELFTGPSPMSGFEDWGWTYKSHGQTWVNAETGNSGNITG